MDEQEIARLNEEQRQVFDRLCERFLVPLPPDVVERMERIVELGGVRPGDTVLDAGAGTGALIPLIQKRSPSRIVACDLSGKMLEHLAARFPDVHCHQCDLRDLELPSSSIDVVFMNAMFGNIADKEGALRNVARMLRPGGRAIISHPEGRAFVDRIARESPFPITPLPSEPEARRLLAAAGLSLDAFVDEPRLYVARGLAPSSESELTAP